MDSASWPTTNAVSMAGVRVRDQGLIPDSRDGGLPGLLFRRRLMVTCDGAGASHDLIDHLDKLAARRGFTLTWSVG
jgi:hypothetical protein